MSQSDFLISVCLIIKSTEPVETISKIIGVEPTSVLEDKNLINSTVPSKQRVWILRKTYSTCTEVGDCVHSFLSDIPQLKDKLSAIQHLGNCALRISIVSLMGQIGFSFSSCNLQRLNQLGIPLEITIFSYGGCIDESTAGQESTGDGLREP